MSLHFREVTPDNWRIINNLEVKKEQKQFVRDSMGILGKAFVYRNNNSKVYIIYKEENPVGLMMQREYLDKDEINCVLDQVMIDKKYQGQGYCKVAMELWVSMIKNENKYNAIILCYIEGNIIAEKMYLSLGFIRRPEEDDEDELVMIYKL